MRPATTTLEYNNPSVVVDGKIAGATSAQKKLNSIITNTMVRQTIKIPIIMSSSSMSCFFIFILATSLATYSMIGGKPLSYSLILKGISHKGWYIYNIQTGY
jgi:hypothetical protein